MAHENRSQKIEHISIRKLDDGTFVETVQTVEEGDGDEMKKFDTHEYSFSDVDDLLDAVEDDLTSPHARKPRLGSGERFSRLEEELKRKGDVRNPAAVAASIGRKKWGKKRFQELAAKGR